MSEKTTANTRGGRLEARISRDQKARFQRAAELQGRTLTDFVITSVHDAAVRVIEEMQTIRLGAKVGSRRLRSVTSSGPVPEWLRLRRHYASSPYRTGMIEKTSPAASSRWIGIPDSRRDRT